VNRPARIVATALPSNRMPTNGELRDFETMSSAPKTQVPGRTTQTSARLPGAKDGASTRIIG
jgi:hypothetical protein